MLSVNTNVAANLAKMHSDYAETKQQVSMVHLSSGSRVNTAADDAAGMAVSSKMKSQIKGLGSVLKNIADGMSLSQLADSSSQQITDIVIRLRELAIQNHNGVYTDQDRQNAEQEKIALIQQIDKIAEQTSFNGVNLLDGTYLQTLRTGNRNEETMQVDLQRLHSDNLGGAVVTTTQSELSRTSPPTDHQNLTRIEAFEATQIRIETSALSTEFQNFTSADPNGRFTLSGVNAADFTVDNSGSIQANSAIYHNSRSDADNTKSLSVTYTDSAGNSKTEQIELTVKLAVPKTSIIRTASSTLSSEEATIVTTHAVASPPGAANNVLSQALQNYTDTFPGGRFSLEGADAAALSIDQDGVITGNLPYNNPADQNSDNIYEFAVKYQAPSGDSFLETVSLTITPSAPASTLGAHNPAIDEFITGSDIALDAIVEDAGFNPVRATVDLDGAGNNDYTTFGFGPFFQDFVALNGSGGTFSLQNISYSGPFTYDPAIHNISIEPGNVLTVGGPGVNDGIPQGDYEATLIYSAGGETFTYDFQMFANTGMASQITLFGSDTFPATSKTSFNNIQMGFDDLNISVLDTPPTRFSMLNQISGMVPGGTLTVSNITAPPSGNISDIQFAGNAFTIDKAAASGTYTADITYSAAGGSVTTSVEFVVTAAPEPPCSNDASASVPAQTGSAGDIFRDNSGTQESTSLRSVRSDIAATEAKKLSFGVFDDPAVISDELKAVANQYPAGSFRLSGTDSQHLTIDQNGQIKLIENADFERKSRYEFSVEYTHDGGVFTDNVSLAISDDERDNVLHLSDISLATAEKAEQAVAVLDDALIQVNRFQSYVGSIQNRLGSSLELTYVTLENASKARGRVIDADFAAETQTMATQQILMQSAQSVLAQANNAKQNILSLIG